MLSLLSDAETCEKIGSWYCNIRSGIVSENIIFGNKPDSACTKCGSRYEINLYYATGAVSSKIYLSDRRCRFPHSNFTVSVSENNLSAGATSAGCSVFRIGIKFIVDGSSSCSCTGDIMIFEVIIFSARHYRCVIVSEINFCDLLMACISLKKNVQCTI